jgi:hypothetical protein
MSSATSEAMSFKNNYRVRKWESESMATLESEFFTRVGTYVQRGSKFCFVVVVVLVLGADTLLNFLHYCPISPCIQQPCPGSLAQQPCQTALPGSLARQPCPAVRPISTGFYARARSLHSHRTVLQWQVTKQHARCCPDRFKLIFSPISPCFHYLHARAAVQQTGSNLFSCSYVDLLHHNNSFTIQ